MNQQPNILFYSKLCKSCNIFINQCHKSNILKYFKLVCVDDRINEFKEKGIKIVPTIYKQGHGKPLEGKEAFMWLETIINNGNMNNATPTPTPATPITQSIRTVGATGSGAVGNIVKRNIIQPTTTNVQNGSGGNNGSGGSNGSGGNNGPSVKKVLDGYLQDEMTGFSDTYALLLTDDPLPKTFATHNTDQEIYTAPEGPKIDWRTQKTLIRNLETQRTSDL
jgi:hypothetical protein